MYLAVRQEIQQRKILKHETAMASDRDAGVGGGDDSVLSERRGAESLTMLQ